MVVKKKHPHHEMLLIFMTHFINQTQTTVNLNHANNVNNFVDNLFQNPVSDCNISKKPAFGPVNNFAIEETSELEYKKDRQSCKSNGLKFMYKYSQSQEPSMNELSHIHSLPVNTNLPEFTKKQFRVYKIVKKFRIPSSGKLTRNREQIATLANCSEKTVTRVLELLKNHSLVRFEKQKINEKGQWSRRPVYADFSPLTAGQNCLTNKAKALYKNKNNIINNSKEKKAFIEPELLKPDFDFTAMEKKIIQERHQVSEIDVEEAAMDWKGYNLHRVGYNWFSSFERFCLAREWPRRIERKRTFNVHVNKAFTPTLIIRSNVPQKVTAYSTTGRLVKKAVKVAWHKPKPKKLAAISVDEREKLMKELMECSSYSHLSYRDRLRVVNFEIDRSYE